MSVSDVVMVLAVLLSPVVALRIQKSLETKREKRERRLNIFRTLMATRRARLSYNHIQALNMIDLEFHPYKKFSNVIDRWKSYLSNLSKVLPAENKDSYQSELTTWASKNDEYFIELLFEMSKALSYDFKKLSLEKEIYNPVAINNLEYEQQLIRECYMNFLAGKIEIPIKIVSDSNQSAST